LMPAPSSNGNTGHQYASKKFFSVTIPAAGIKDLTITHPTNATTSQGLLAPLQAGVGHLFSYPGKGGKILVYGHSSSYPWDVSGFTKIFRQINKLNVGDKIYVTYNGKLHVYQVTHESVVPASDTTAYRGGGSEELILYTCWPPDDIKQRYLVHAKPVETIALK
jgi:LPXTG-site transpeptidase (sortase) family protein